MILLNKTQLTSGLSPLAKESIQNLVILDTVDSTMNEAKRILQDNDNHHCTLITAEHQSQGKGRLGRSFYSPEHSGLYFSFIYNASEYAPRNTNPVSVTVTAAVAVHKALQTFGFDTKIKWVNDLFYNDKKVCGILTKGVNNTFIIGIGINIEESPEGFPSEIKDIATSLSQKIDRNKLLACILNNMLELLRLENQEPILEEYREHSLVIEKEVLVIKPTETYPVKVLSITNEAHLLVEREDGTNEELLSGEVSLRLH